MSSRAELGALLKERRHQVGYSREQAGRETGLSVEFIRAAENETEAMATDIYTVGKLRSYGRALGIKKKDIERLLLAKDSAPKKRRSRPMRIQHKIRAPVVTSNVLLQALLVLIVGSLVGYILWQIVALTGNPQLYVEFPSESQVVRTRDIEIVGSTTPGAEVEIDGQPVLVSDDGSFRLPITLDEGVYTLNIRSRSNLGRTSEIDRTVVVEPLEN